MNNIDNPYTALLYEHLAPVSPVALADDLARRDAFFKSVTSAGVVKK